MIGVRFSAQAMLLCLSTGLAACHGGGRDGASIPGDRSDTQPYQGISEQEELRFRGTEPFWGGEILGNEMTWRTPGRPEGQRFTVSRFNGRGGFSYSGKIDGVAFTMAVTPGRCSDGMSDRVYPYGVTLLRGEEKLDGCAWSKSRPFTRPAAP